MGPGAEAAMQNSPALKELTVQKPDLEAGPAFSLGISLGPEGTLALFSFLGWFHVLEHYPVPQNFKLPAIIIVEPPCPAQS